jgi:hypothetical protein
VPFAALRVMRAICSSRLMQMEDATDLRDEVAPDAHGRGLDRQRATREPKYNEG